MTEAFYSDSNEANDYQQLLMENSLCIRHFMQRMRNDITGEDMVFCVCCIFFLAI